MGTAASAHDHGHKSTPRSRALVAAQAAKAQVALSKRLGIKVNPKVQELARKAQP